MAQKENPKGWRENGNDRRSVESKSSASNATGNDAVAHRLTQLEELLVEAMVQIRELRERVQVLEERAAPPADQNQRLPELVEEPRGTDAVPPSAVAAAESSTPSQSSVQAAPVRAEASVNAPDAAFCEWMTSKRPTFSIWKKDEYRRLLIGYVGKIFQQQNRVGQVIESFETRGAGGDELDQLHWVVREFQKQPGATEALADWQSNNRSNNRLREVQRFFAASGAHVKGGLRIQGDRRRSGEAVIDRESIEGYFDLICRDGFITEQIGEYLELLNENIFGGDENQIRVGNFTFIRVKLQESTIALAASRVDLITCFSVLHHVPQLQPMLAELARILRPKGYLIMREHDCNSERSPRAKYFNFIHAFMIIAGVGEFAHMATERQEASANNSPNDVHGWKRMKDEILRHTSSIHYRTQNEWQGEMREAGFRLVASFDYGGANNPQAIFFQVYQLDKNGISN